MYSIHSNFSEHVLHSSIKLIYTHPPCTNANQHCPSFLKALGSCAHFAAGALIRGKTPTLDLSD